MRGIDKGGLPYEKHGVHIGNFEKLPDTVMIEIFFHKTKGYILSYSRLIPLKVL